MLGIILNCFYQICEIEQCKEFHDYSVVTQHYVRILEYHLGHHKGS